jgi:hypothetical protein
MADQAIPSPEETLTLDPKEFPGGVGLWGALPAVYDTTAFSEPEEGIHVHARLEAGKRKLIDRSFAVVRVIVPALLREDSEIVITAEAARAYVATSVFGFHPKALRCSHCNSLHLDAGKYAVMLHRKHLCGACGREFFDFEPSISNPLAEVRSLFRDDIDSRPLLKVDRPFEKLQSQFIGGMRLWGSNKAVLWTSAKSEEEGIGTDFTIE